MRFNLFSQKNPQKQTIISIFEIVEYLLRVHELLRLSKLNAQLLILVNTEY